MSRLVGHTSTLVTELVYRKQLRPVLQADVPTMARLFTVNGSQEVREAVEPGPSGEVPGSDLR